jgi:hypothetical protein
VDNLDIIGSQFSEPYNFPLGVSSFSFPFTLPSSVAAGILSSFQFCVFDFKINNKKQKKGSYKAVVGVYDAAWTINIAWSDPAIVFTACASCCMAFDHASASPNPVNRGSSTVRFFIFYL